MQGSANHPPHLNLAPQLKRPLSLWNPLDYLRLFYWVCYFPQAFRWYGETFGTPRDSKGSQDSLPWRQRFARVWGDRIQRQLWLQMSLMTVAVSGGVLGSAIQLGASLPDGLMLLIPVLISLALTLGLIISFPASLVAACILTLCFTILLVPISGIPDEARRAIWTNVPVSVVFGVSVGLFSGLLLGLSQTIGVSLKNHIPVHLLNLKIHDYFIKFAIGMPGGVLSAAVSFLTFTLDPWLAWRPDAWLLGKVFQSQTEQNCPVLSHVSIFPDAALTTQLKRRLQTDWLAGLQDCNEVLRYSLQFIPVLEAIDRTLVAGPAEHLVWRIAHLTEQPLGWQLTGYTATGLAAALQPRPTFLSLPRIPRLTHKAAIQLTPESCQLDTPAHAAASGFWLLHQQQPAAAAKAFNCIYPLNNYALELYTLARALDACQQTTNLTALHTLKLPRCPEPDPTRRLRSVSWQAIAYFDQAIHELQLAHESDGAYSRADAYHQARLNLQQVIELEPQLPAAERELIRQIATTWLGCLVQVAEV
ncbi:MAG: hypothetical protein AAGG51_04970 [Cyanobacteria bacterium P01_G01_bin.54]